jgi:hypothetical protein
VEREGEWAEREAGRELGRRWWLAGQQQSQNLSRRSLGQRALPRRML